VSLAGKQQSLRLDALDARYAGETLKLLHPATAEWGGGTLALHGLEAEASEGGRLSADLALTRDSLAATMAARKLPLSFIAAFSPGLDVDGTLEADVALSGTPQQPEGHAQVKFAGVRSGALEGVDMAALGGTLDATLRQGDLAATAKLDSPPGVTLNASLGVPLALVPEAGETASYSLALDDGAPLTGKVDGNLDLSLLPGLIDLAGDRVGGRLEAQLALSGTVGTPDVRGQARLVSASYESADLGTVVRGLDAEVEGDRSQVVIRSLKGNDGEGGHVSATGALTLDAKGELPFRLDGKLEHFLVLRRDDATVAADGTLAVERTPDGGTINGQFTVRSAELRIPEAQPPSIVKLEVVEVNPPAHLHRIRVTQESLAAAAAAPPPPAEPWKLDIDVDFPGQVFVRGRGLDSEWRGHVDVTGTADSPDITGNLEAVRGSMNILERTLTVDRGVITFTGGSTIDPLIDVVTSAKIEGTQVQLALRGTVSNPKLEATSDSGLPQDEVLALILFGKRLDTLSPAQAVQLASAAATLTGSGPDVLDSVRRQVGLDFLGVQSTSGDSSGEGSDTGATGTLDSATLRAGKYITEDIFVHVDQGLTPESRRVGVEVRVLPETLPGVTVNSDVGADSSSSVGVNWKFDY
jgi:translocation and assembly module TamB